MSHLISKLAIAPMIDWTYTHFRVLMRLLAPHALLYTDMQTTGAIQHQPHRALNFHHSETPLALQLGGADPNALAQAAKEAERRGYQEINLNLGCPSDRVQSGRFGACLMADVKTVMDCIQALKNAVNIPVTAKTRIGIDTYDSYDFFADFAHHLIEAGCDKLIIHARKAWLKGLNPKQNRTIPPVNYEYVYRLKQELPHIPIVINGNIQSLEAIQTHLQHVDGVMLGRLACDNPYAIATIHHALYSDCPLLSREALLSQYATYLQGLELNNLPISLLIKPLFTLFHGLPGAKMWKEELITIQRSKSIQRLQEVLLNPAAIFNRLLQRVSEEVY